MDNILRYSQRTAPFYTDLILPLFLAVMEDRALSGVLDTVTGLTWPESLMSGASFVSDRRLSGVVTSLSLASEARVAMLGTV